MPPKAKITRDIILDGAFELIRTQGEENLNARTLSQALHCSTQPVLYHFDTMDQIRREAFQRAEEYHIQYIMEVRQEYENPMLEIALRYIRFAREEKHLFRFLFQTDHFERRTLSDWTKDDRLRPILDMICQLAAVDEDTANMLFTCTYMIMHGYASMFANNSVTYEESEIIRNLQTVFAGIRNERMK